MDAVNDMQTIPLRTAIAVGGYAVAIVVALYFWFLRSYASDHSGQRNHLPSVPEVPGVPVLGNLLQLKEKNPYMTFTKWAETYGPIFSVRTGATSMVVVSSNDIAKEVLVTKFASMTTKKLSNALKVLTEDKTMVSMSDYNDYHKTAKRHILTAVLGPNAQKKHRVHRDTMMENVSNELHTLFKNFPNKEVNLRKIFQSELFGLGMKQTMGKDLESLYVEDLETTMKRDEIFQVLVVNPMMSAIEVDWREIFPYFRWVPNKSFEYKMHQMYTRRKVVMKALIQEHIKRIASGQNLNSYIDYLLLEAQTLTDKELRMSLWEPIIESTNTTMVAIEWAMYELAKNPKMQDCLYAEIQSVCGSEKITEENLCQLSYLYAVFQETLRRHCPVPIIPLRYVHEDTVLGGYHLPAGTKVMINIYGCNMEKIVWENPEEWNPERFLNQKEGMDLYKTMGFGGGKRACAGSLQAMLISCVGIGRLVQEFEWRLKDEVEEDASTHGLTTKKLHPLLAIIKPRK
ncbi:hypothetical protein L2E82_46863 [Cichorium intybus]|uniref:Uncharacterized protein n=1 Tax=Cichorium intybus TaxID=13427 RepID=A0ACB8YU76_CICIN|nr:hypothetical protein L2E82_46863 [Cichorium intybus]